jgi:hypothetical protein
VRFDWLATSIQDSTVGRGWDVYEGMHLLYEAYILFVEKWEVEQRSHARYTKQNILYLELLITKSLEMHSTCNPKLISNNDKLKDHSLENLYLQ